MQGGKLQQQASEALPRNSERKMNRCHFLPLAVALSLLVLPGCSDDSSGPEDTRWVGTYTLELYGGHTLPVLLVQMENEKHEVTAGSMVLTENLRFSSSYTIRITVAGDVTWATSDFSGTVAKNGNALTFTYSHGAVYAGSLSGDTLEFYQEPGVTHLFRK
jgi:hypothetical protein